MKNLFVTLAILIVQATVLALPAYAMNADVSPAALRQQEARPNLITINGSLVCRMGEVNNGQACEIKIKDSTTGSLYNLSNAQTAMELYHSGKTQVSIQGRLADSDTIAVTNINAL